MLCFITLNFKKDATIRVIYAVITKILSRKKVIRVKKRCFSPRKGLFLASNDPKRVKKGAFSREKLRFLTRIRSFLEGIYLIFDAIRAGVSVILPIVVIDGLKNDKVL